MTNKSISAYNDEERVRQYDADMDLMHPRRHKMIEIALEVLPYEATKQLRALDLGIGTGLFTSRFLQQYPMSVVTGVDGAEAMIQLAKTRLQGFPDRVNFAHGSFQNLRSTISEAHGFDVVFSSYALHHLDKDSKQRVLSDAVSLLKDGGWFVNGDLIVYQYPDLEGRIQDIRVRGIHERKASSDGRFEDLDSIRKFLEDLETNEGDQPITIQEDLQLLRESGICNASLFWQEYREAVYGGSKGSV